MAWFVITLLALAEALAQADPSPAVVPSLSPSPPTSPAPAGAPTSPNPETAVEQPSPPPPLPTTTAPKKAKKSAALNGWGVLAGISLGSFSEGSVSAPEGFEAHRGSVYGGQLIATYQQKRYVADLALGLRLANITGVEPDAAKPQSRVDAEVNSKAGVVGIAARYRLLALLEVGGGLTEWFADDLSFSALATTPKTATFAQFQVAGTFSLAKWLLRAIVAAEFDLTIPDRQITIYTLNLEGGIAFGKQLTKKRLKSKASPVIDPIVTPSPIPKN